MLVGNATPNKKCCTLRQITQGENIMAIAIATLANTPYQMGNTNPPIMHNAFPALAYDWNAARVTTVLGVGLNGATSVTLALNGAGDSVYLPYGQGEVHSVRLPGPGPAAAGVTCFITAGMSGCRLYVDRVVGTNDIIVYHANSIGVGGGVANPMGMDVEGPGLPQALDNLHALARVYWTTPAPGGPGLNLATIGTLGRNAYNASAVREMQRKVDEGRTQVDFWGGTTVVGELTPAGWQMNWQTYGDVTYVRPASAPKGWIQGQDKAVGNMNYRVLSSRLWFP